MIYKIFETQFILDQQRGSRKDTCFQFYPQINIKEVTFPVKLATCLHVREHKQIYIRVVGD